VPTLLLAEAVQEGACPGAGVLAELGADFSGGEPEAQEGDAPCKKGEHMRGAWKRGGSMGWRACQAHALACGRWQATAGASSTLGIHPGMACT